MAQSKIMVFTLQSNLQKKKNAHQFASSVLHVLSGVPTAYGANPPCMRKSKAQMPPQVSPAKHSWLEGAPQGFAAVMGSGKPCKASKMLRHGGTKHRFKMIQNVHKHPTNSKIKSQPHSPGQAWPDFSIPIVWDCTKPQGNIFFVLNTSCVLFSHEMRVNPPEKSPCLF